MLYTVRISTEGHAPQADTLKPNDTAYTTGRWSYTVRNLFWDDQELQRVNNGGYYERRFGSTTIFIQAILPSYPVDEFNVYGWLLRNKDKTHWVAEHTGSRRTRDASLNATHEYMVRPLTTSDDSSVIPVLKLWLRSFAHHDESSALKMLAQ